MQMVMKNLDVDTMEMLPYDIAECKECLAKRHKAADQQGKLRVVVGDNGEKLDLYAHPGIVNKLAFGLKAFARGEVGSEERVSLRTMQDA